jgi:phosphate-selective porin OprO/OprP
VKVKNPVQWGKGKGGWGAWQIAGRYDVLDLSDAAFNNASGVANFTGGCANTRLGVNQFTAPSTGPANPIRLAQCGEQETWLIGVNWYLTDYVRLLFNYAESDLSGFPTTTVAANSSGVPTGTRVNGFDGAKIRGFGMRAHVDW